MKVGIIILAAGASSRMGSPKQLLNINGSTLIRRITTESLKSKCHSVIVVVGSHKESIKPVLQDLPIYIVENKCWKEGMASSIIIGLKYCNKHFEDLDAVILATSDMPEISASLFNKLIKKAKIKDKAVIVSKYAGVKGIPALFKLAFFEKLLTLKGDNGAKQLFDSHRDEIATINFENGNVDLDTKEDYLKYLNSLN